MALTVRALGRNSATLRRTNVAHYEHVHERISEPLGAEYIEKRKADGWSLVGVVWERQIDAVREPEIEVPFGLRVAEDCRHLTEEPGEKEALLLMLEMIVQDRRVTDVALELNRRGYKTRDGRAWSPTAVFDMMPRLIEEGAREFASEEWAMRRKVFAGGA
jgi:Recombinase